MKNINAFLLTRQNTEFLIFFPEETSSVSHNTFIHFLKFPFNQDFLDSCFIYFPSKPTQFYTFPMSLCVLCVFFPNSLSAY